MRAEVDIREGEPGP